MTPLVLPPYWAPTACATFTASYVGVLYLIPNARSRPWQLDPVDQQPLNRQHPKVIKARVLSVGLSSLLSVVGVGGLIRKTSKGQLTATALVERTLDFTGLLPNAASGLKSVLQNLASLALPLGLTATLFLGPLYTRYLDHDRAWKALLPWHGAAEPLRSWRGFRNYVAGPLTEEVVFRSCVVSAETLSGLSRAKVIFLSPLWFGIAHAHHAWEIYLTNGRTRQALVQGTAQAAFQFLYTTLFGWFATFIFLRTGSVYSAVVCHSFCNFMGLPPLASALKEHPRHRFSIGASYLTGIAGFAYGLWRWTDPVLFGGSIYWP